MIDEIQWRIERIYYWIRHRTIDRYNRIYIPTLKPGYYDIDTLMLHGIMSLIVRYVEREDALNFINWNHPTDQEIKACCKTRKDKAEAIKYRKKLNFVRDEIIAIYNWWKNYEKLEEERWKAIELKCGDGVVIKGEKMSLQDAVEKYGNKHPAIKKYRKQIKDSADLEGKHYQEDTDMIIRAIKIRAYLWT